MPVHISCEECDGTGWVLYRSETLNGDLEEAYRLCPGGCIPRYCMARSNERPCRRPGTARYGLGYFCKQHVEAVSPIPPTDYRHRNKTVREVAEPL